MACSRGRRTPAHASLDLWRVRVNCVAFQGKVRAWNAREVNGACSGKSPRTLHRTEFLVPARKTLKGSFIANLREASVLRSGVTFGPVAVTVSVAGIARELLDFQRGPKDENRLREQGKGGPLFVGVPLVEAVQRGCRHLAARSPRVPQCSRWRQG